jgi:hypothetical protein
MLTTLFLFLFSVLSTTPAFAAEEEGLTLGAESAAEGPVDPGGVEPPAGDSAVAIGKTKTFGLGVVVGDPNGFSAKKYLGGRTHALDFAVAYRLFGPFGASYYAHSTYLVHPNEFLELDGVVLGWHMGVGGYLGLAFVDDGYGNKASAVGLGARAPIGIDIDLESLPLQMFFDVAVNIGVVPSTYLSAEGNLGFRFYFL